MTYRKTIITLLIILAAAFTLAGCSNSTPKATAQKFLNAIVAGDVETMENCKLPLSKSQSSAMKEVAKGITNSMFNINLGNDGMNAIAGLYLSYTFAGYEFEVTDAEIDGKRAKAFFDIYIDGDLYSSREYLPMTQYDGDWYVDFSGYYN